MVTREFEGQGISKLEYFIITIPHLHFRYAYIFNCFRQDCGQESNFDYFVARDFELGVDYKLV